LDIVKKIWPLSENFSPLLVSQAGYGPVTNSITSTVTGDKNVRRCDKILYAGPKSVRNILTN